MSLKVALMPNKYNRLDLFEKAGIDTVEGAARTPDEMVQLLSDVDGALVNTRPRTSREVMEACPKLKVVSRMGVGVDSIDLPAATELGILVCHVPGVNTAEVADHAVAMLLALTRRLYETITATRQGQWSDNPPLMSEFQQSVRRIGGHTVGIVGFGNIGRAFALRVRGFGPAQIIAYDPFVEQSAADLYGVRLVSLEELASESDYISIHSSATQQNYHLFDRTMFAKMKPTAIIVNCSRGPLIDQTALLAALRDGQIEAAAIDVTEVEPIEHDDPLLKLPNLIITPHLAGYSPTFLDECPRKQAENVIHVLTGKRPHGLANPEVIKTIAVMRASRPGRWEGSSDFSIALDI
ncbi:MAG: C-terminal binding protein [Candidatus Tectomicrobia bacterium]